MTELSPTDGGQPAWRLTHLPALDGVRGLAVLLVLLSHALPEGTMAPGAGVSLFFVLSGFLITSLLWEEWGDSGRLDLARFFGRRVRRLVPAFVVVLVFSAISLAIVGRAAEGVLYSAAAATYLSNVLLAGGTWLGPLAHTWSLAIEEQFYVVWPLGLLLAAPRLRPAIVVVALLAGAISIQIARAAEWLSEGVSLRLSFATEMQADGIMLGAALAILMHQRTLRLPAATAPLAIGLLLAAQMVIPRSMYQGLGNTLAVLASAALVAALASRAAGQADPLFGNTWLRRLGLISYGLYLWHYLVMWHLGFFENRPYPGLVVALMGVGLSVAAATLSYRLVERRFLSRGRRHVPPDEPAADEHAADADALHPQSNLPPSPAWALGVARPGDA